MSDTEDEPFDKEAEREKLRQQLAEEEAARESTQHMSELLLKGATMTNRHCDECGDPLFRHDGQEFCPTCGRRRAAGGEQPPEAGATEPDAPAAGEGGAAAAPDQAEGEPPGEAPPAAQSTAPGQFQAGEHSAPAPAGEADLPDARQALARKVTALAQEAEATSDVGRARELLAAVREGAEALRALEGRSR